MSLNIKNERVLAMVREAARLTGRTQTGAIEDAMRAYLAGLTRDARWDRVDALLADIHRQVTPAMRDGFTAEDLYDDAGLPR